MFRKQNSNFVFTGKVTFNRESRVLVLIKTKGKRSPTLYNANKPLTSDIFIHIYKEQRTLYARDL